MFKMQTLICLSLNHNSESHIVIVIEWLNSQNAKRSKCKNLNCISFKNPINSEPHRPSPWTTVSVVLSSAYNEMSLIAVKI